MGCLRLNVPFCLASKTCQDFASEKSIGDDQFFHRRIDFVHIQLHMGRQIRTGMLDYILFYPLLIDTYGIAHLKCDHSGIFRDQLPRPDRNRFKI
jgi:hypothetical protein